MRCRAAFFLIAPLMLASCGRDAPSPAAPSRPPSGASAAVVGATALDTSAGQMVALRYGLEDARTRLLPTFADRAVASRIETNLAEVSAALREGNAAASREAVQQSLRALANAEAQPGMGAHAADLAAIRRVLELIDAAQPPSAGARP